MKVGLNTRLTCQPIRYTSNNDQTDSKVNNNATTFKSKNMEQVSLSVNEKYEIAKQIIAAQTLRISELQKQVATGLPKTNFVNVYSNKTMKNE